MPENYNTGFCLPYNITYAIPFYMHVGQVADRTSCRSYGFRWIWVLIIRDQIIVVLKFDRNIVETVENYHLWNWIKYFASFKLVKFAIYQYKCIETTYTTCSLPNFASEDAINSIILIRKSLNAYFYALVCLLIFLKIKINEPANSQLLSQFDMQSC